MLFLLHLAHKMRAPEDGGGRVGIVMNGSPLFNGGAGSGPSEIRRWLLESEPNRAQRNETAVRWFLVALLEPEDRRVVLERELRNVEDLTAYLQETAERLDAMGGHPFRPTVDLGLRTGAVMDEWLREQIDALDHPHPFRPTVDLGQRTTAVMRQWLCEQMESAAEGDREPG
jgi:hypothetical protein